MGWRRQIAIVYVAKGVEGRCGSDFYSKTEDKFVVLRVFRGDTHDDSVAILKYLQFILIRERGEGDVEATFI